MKKMKSACLSICTCTALLLLAGSCKKEAEALHFVQRYFVHYILTDSVVYARATIWATDPSDNLVKMNDTSAVTANGLIWNNFMHGDQYGWHFDSLTDITFVARTPGRYFTNASRLSALGVYSFTMDTLIDRNNTATIHWDGDPIRPGTNMLVFIAKTDENAPSGGTTRYSEPITSKDHVLSSKIKTLEPGRYLISVERNIEFTLDEPDLRTSGQLFITASAYQFVTIQ